MTNETALALAYLNSRKGFKIVVVNHDNFPQGLPENSIPLVIERLPDPTENVFFDYKKEKQPRFLFKNIKQNKRK